MRRESFPAVPGLVFEAITGSGEVFVSAAADGQVVVELDGGPEDEFTVELIGTDLVVRPPAGRRSGKHRFVSTDIKLHVPDDARGAIKTASGDVLVQSPLGGLTVVSASGDIRVGADISGHCDVKTASGDIKLRCVEGNVDAASASGDIAVEDIGGDLRCSNASGDVTAASVGGAITSKCVSGAFTVDAALGTKVAARSLSGEVSLGIPSGRTVDLDLQTLTGELVNRLTKSASASGERAPLSIAVKTVSGDLKLMST